MPCQLKSKFGLKESGTCGRCAKNIHNFVKIAVQGATSTVGQQDAFVPAQILQ
jgi:bacterioferritin-associated ferredoxin